MDRGRDVAFVGKVADGRAQRAREERGRTKHAGAGACFFWIMALLKKTSDADDVQRPCQHVDAVAGTVDIVPQLDRGSGRQRLNIDHINGPLLIGRRLHGPDAGADDADIDENGSPELGQRVVVVDGGVRHDEIRARRHVVTPS